jgi:hypothetical protein
LLQEALVAVAQLSQLTVLSRTAALAIAILEAALKQMHVCALLHNDVNHPSHSPACFFCWPHQPELHAASSSCYLLLACWWLVVPAAGWCLPVLHGALVLAFSALRASIWGSHIETPYKKQQLKKAMPFAIYGGPAAGRLRVLCQLLLLRARCSLCCCCVAVAAAAVASIATKTAAAAAATARTTLLLLLLLPCLLPAPPHLLPRSPPDVRCSFFAFSSCSFSTSCCFLAFSSCSSSPPATSSPLEGFRWCPQRAR